jgi:hypothetical protein
MDDGAQRIEDEAELRQVRAQARRVHVQSFALAIVGTVLAFLLPV